MRTFGGQSGAAAGYGEEGQGWAYGQVQPFPWGQLLHELSRVTGIIHPPGMKDLRQLGLTRQRFKWENK